jgi:hypothetical protein
LGELLTCSTGWKNHPSDAGGKAATTARPDHPARPMIVMALRYRMVTRLACSAGIKAAARRQQICHLAGEE